MEHGGANKRASSAAEQTSEQMRVLEYIHLAATKKDLQSVLANHKIEETLWKLSPFFCPRLTFQSVDYDIALMA